MKCLTFLALWFSALTHNVKAFDTPSFSSSFSLSCYVLVPSLDSIQTSASSSWVMGLYSHRFHNIVIFFLALLFFSSHVLLPSHIFFSSPLFCCLTRKFMSTMKNASRWKALRRQLCSRKKNKNQPRSVMLCRNFEYYLIFISVFQVNCIWIAVASSEKKKVNHWIEQKIQ